VEEEAAVGTCEDVSSLSEARQAVVARLARIEGHVRGVSRMVQEDQPCAELLTQFAAIRAAVDSVSRLVLTNHVEHCLRRAVNEGSAEEVWAPLRRALELFIR
jgi:DNA-binding FrmR family transcriptional regulator